MRQARAERAFICVGGVSAVHLKVLLGVVRSAPALAKPKAERDAAIHMVAVGDKVGVIYSLPALEIRQFAG